MTGQRIDHSNVIIWRVRQEDASHTWSIYLRMLSHIAKGTPGGSAYQRNGALAWARGLVEQGLDVTYDTAGWRTIEADRSSWHIKKVLEDAENASKEA
ncbi:hypothetical protein ABZ470_31955 [Streptosporangium sp. NPDC020072]|uniref:hypothetical protein n=1 Tax=Streptosporangium sp. NPDC020072 TaxID=3154788 RepID=UPI003435BB6B